MKFAAGCFFFFSFIFFLNKGFLFLSFFFFCFRFQNGSVGLCKKKKKACEIRIRWLSKAELVVGVGQRSFVFFCCVGPSSLRFVFVLFVFFGSSRWRRAPRKRPRSRAKKKRNKTKTKKIETNQALLVVVLFFSFVVGMAADWIVSRAPTNQSASSASFTSDACKHVPLADAALSFFFCFFLEIGNRGNSTFLSFVFVFCFSFRLFGFPNNNNNNGDQFFFVFIVIVFFVRRSSLR